MSVNEENIKNDKESYFGSVKFFKNLITVFIILIILALSAGLLYVIFIKKDTANNVYEVPKTLLSGEEIKGRGMVITPDNIDEMRAQVENFVPDGHYSAEMNVEWTFEKWNIPSKDVYVVNSIDNIRTVYFDLFLKETNELIYSSPFIPVGAKLPPFALDKEIPEGEHQAVVTYHLVDDDFNNITEVSITVLLIILG